MCSLDVRVGLTRRTSVCSLDVRVGLTRRTSVCSLDVRVGLTRRTSMCSLDVRVGLTRRTSVCSLDVRVGLTRRTSVCSLDVRVGLTRRTSVCSLDVRVGLTRRTSISDFFSINFLHSFRIIKTKWSLGRPRNKPTLYSHCLYLQSISASVQKTYDEGKARKVTCNGNVSFLCVSCMQRYMLVQLLIVCVRKCIMRLYRQRIEYCA